MGFIRMARPARRSDSTVIQFRQRIPRDVLEQVRGCTLHVPVGGDIVEKVVSGKAKDVELSLRTRDPSEAKGRHAAVSAYLDGLYRELRASHAPPIALTHRQAKALAGVVYNSWSADDVAESLRRKLMAKGSAEDTAEVMAAVADIMKALRAKLSRTTAALPGPDVRPLVDRLLRSHGIAVDEETRSLIVHETQDAMVRAADTQHRHASGDYNEEADKAEAGRYPQLKLPAAPNKAKAGKTSKGMTPLALFDAWKAHPDQEDLSPSTRASYFKTFERFEAFLAKTHGHVPSAEAVSRDDVEQYAESRAATVKKRTVNDTDLAALNSVFSWAVSRRRLNENPAQSVRLKVRKRGGREARKTLNDEEALKILTHALRCEQPSSGKLGRKTAAAKRWVPWLMAYSGTRVGEMAQLRKEDIAVYEGHWAIRVTSEAGTVKTRNTWRIPIHPHLIELGFLTFVQTAPEGHLFLTPRPDLYDPDAPESRTKDERGILGPLKALTNRLREFTREVVPKVDAVSPNHGWRHKFKARGRLNNIDPVVLDCFFDHAPRTEGESYGRDDLFPAMVEALKKIPRYAVE